MAERTPEPWHVEYSESEHFGMARINVKHHGITVAGLHMAHYPTAKANAHLIAAAPDMEKALEAWLEWDGEIRETPSPPMLARAVLAKARGETL